MRNRIGITRGRLSHNAFWLTASGGVMARHNGLSIFAVNSEAINRHGLREQYAMRDIVRDWRRWSRAERVTAVLIVTILMVGVPLALGVSLASTMPARHSTGISSPF